jgi:RHS repeat-associated protein
MDAETGFYYYGARYLDPKTSRWISADPAVGDYIPGAGKGSEGLAGMGGVYNTVNLHLYHYAGNNPVKYTDPDGRKFVISGSIFYRVQTWFHLRRIERALRRSGDAEALNAFIKIKDDETFVIQIRKPTPEEKGNFYDARGNSEAHGIIGYNPSDTERGLDVSGSEQGPGFIGLGHEVKHGIDHREGEFDENHNQLITRQITDETRHYREENSAIDFENSVRKGHYGNDSRKRLPAEESHPYPYGGRSGQEME